MKTLEEWVEEKKFYEKRSKRLSKVLAKHAAKKPTTARAIHKHNQIMDEVMSADFKVLEIEETISTIKAYT